MHTFREMFLKWQSSLQSSVVQTKSLIAFHKLDNLYVQQISPQMFLLTEEHFENKLRSLRPHRSPSLVSLLAPKPLAHENESTWSCFWKLPLCPILALDIGIRGGPFLTLEEGLRDFEKKKKNLTASKSRNA